MTNFRYTTTLVEVYPSDTSQGKRIRIVHRYREHPDSYFESEAAKRAQEIQEAQAREDLQKRIQAARDSGASFYDLGNGMRMVFPSLIPIPEGVQPLSKHIQTLPVMVSVNSIVNFKQPLEGV